MSFLEQLRRALEMKQGDLQERPARTPVPDPIVYATAGTRLASDGREYTITYEGEGK